MSLSTPPRATPSPPYRGAATPSAREQPSSRRKVAHPSGAPSVEHRATHSSPTERGVGRRRTSRRRQQQQQPRSRRSPRHPAPSRHLKYRGAATPSASEQPSSRRRARPSGAQSAEHREKHSSPTERGDGRIRASRRRKQQLRSCRSPRHPAPRRHLKYRGAATPSASEQPSSRRKVARPSGALSVEHRATHSSPTERGVGRRRASRRRKQQPR